MVRAKKHLGQHFLRDENIARKTAEAVRFRERILEIGPGTGVLTKFLFEHQGELKVVELDNESVDYLLANQILSSQQVFEADFLKLKLSPLFKGEFALVGNFPYNISSQILFKLLHNMDLIPECVGMFQKEVAERVCAPHGNKTYGILSVLCQSYYECELLFTIGESSFVPPPKVKSAVIRLERKDVQNLPFAFSDLQKVVKLAFNQRRKMLSNSLKSLQLELPPEYASLRPEQMRIEDFWKIAAIL